MAEVAWAVDLPAAACQTKLLFFGHEASARIIHPIQLGEKGLFIIDTFRVEVGDTHTQNLFLVEQTHLQTLDAFLLNVRVTLRVTSLYHQFLY